MIEFNNWKIENVGDYGYQYDHLSRILFVRGVPDGYQWKMHVKADGNFDAIALDEMKDGVGAVLTKDNLSVSGCYELQLVGKLLSDGVTVRHTNVIRVFVPPSLSGDVHWPTVPTEFSQMEQRIQEIAQHPPIPGENGYWLTWDASAKFYVESEFPLSELSGGSGGTTDHSKLSNRDAADQHPMSSITGLEAALEGKQPAGAYLTEETDPTVPAWAKAATKPGYTAAEVGADPAGTAAFRVADHNTGTDSHSDIRLLIQGLTDRLNALADSDDTTLDQLSEVVAYIKSNRDLIAAITTDKVSVTDIVNDLTTNVPDKPLSAAQGVALKALIDAITVPDKLPNPNALTFTGAVNGSYDGSAPLIVEIPSGGGSSSWETVIDTTLTEEAVIDTGEMPGKTEVMCLFAVPKHTVAILQSAKSGSFGASLNGFSMAGATYGKVGCIYGVVINGHVVQFAGSGDTTSATPTIGTTARVSVVPMGLVKPNSVANDTPLKLAVSLPTGTQIKVFVR